MTRWKVPLPPGAEPPYRVFVSGVPQQQGKDYELEDHTLWFERPLAKEPPLGFWRWTALFLGLFGSYRPHDSVDVQYRLHGSDRIAVGLDIVSPAEQDVQERPEAERPDQSAVQDAARRYSHPDEDSGHP